jgi:uncharacterized membrane protein YGL010W
MKTIQMHFKDYDAFHRTTGNKLTHVVGIPMIVMSLLGMLDRIVLVPWEFPVHASPGLALWAFGIAFYMVLHPLLGASMIVTTGALFYAGTQLPLSVNVALFVVGWVFQGIGHAVYEKKKPAFLKNVTHFLIGPAYIQNYLLPVVKLK